jgi:hypothetical protein
LHLALRCVTARRLTQHNAAQDDGEPDAAAPVADAAAGDAGGASAPPASAEPAEPPLEAQAFRVRTLTVPISVANAAPSADRMHALLRLADSEGGAPVSLACVDCDGTVIVSHLHAGLVPPEVLHGAEEPEDDDECLPATVMPDEPAVDASAGVALTSLAAH